MIRIFRQPPQNFKWSGWARATGFTAAEVRRTIAMYTQGRTLGLLGEARVNVLEVNLALEGLLPNGHGVSGASDAAPR